MVSRKQSLLRWRPNWRWNLDNLSGLDAIQQSEASGSLGATRFFRTTLNFSVLSNGSIVPGNFNENFNLRYAQFKYAPPMKALKFKEREHASGTIRQHLKYLFSIHLSSISGMILATTTVISGNTAVRR